MPSPIWPHTVARPARQHPTLSQHGRAHSTAQATEMLVGLWLFYFAAMADAWCVCVLSRYLFSFIQNGKRRPRAVRPRHDSQSFARRPGAPRVMCKVKCVIVFSASQVLKTKNHLAVSQSQSFYHTPLARSSRPTLTLYFGLLSSVLTLYSGLLSSVRSHSTLVFFQVRCGILCIFFFLLEGRRTSGSGLLLDPFTFYLSSCGLCTWHCYFTRWVPRPRPPRRTAWRGRR